ncbi:MAG: biopolymer transporter ExbD [Treponema sp.]|jgi:biopolymer transport protein ExbD|nr:biopolymer transporter ExbD [Treponema sp.]
MNLKRKKRAGYYEGSAASDVAFQLIIYFLVITGFNVNEGFIMNLPARDSVRLIQRGDLLRFDMDSQGTILYEGTVMDRSVVEYEIRLALQEQPELAVVLTIDPAAPWQQVVSFVELAQKLEVQSFSFRMSSNP